MRLTAHQERRENVRTARMERAKAIVRLEMLVIRAETEGLDVEQTNSFLRMHRAEFALAAGQQPLGISAQSIWRLRVHLQLVSGRQRAGHGVGRRDSKSALLEVRP